MSEDINSYRIYVIECNQGRYIDFVLPGDKLTVGKLDKIIDSESTQEFNKSCELLIQLEDKHNLRYEL